jgi:hypothetical protein
MERRASEVVQPESPGVASPDAKMTEADMAKQKKIKDLKVAGTTAYTSNDFPTVRQLNTSGRTELC